MAESTIWAVPGRHGQIVVREWPHHEATWLAVLVHGYGEHVGRYHHVADRLLAAGAVVVGPDHEGHGLSAGERVLIADYESVVDDLHAVVSRARAEHPGLPVVMIGHSMGGMIAARYAQRYGDELAVLVLSGPVLGSWAATSMLDLPEIPDAPLDITTLSRDPEVGRRYAADDLVWHGPFKRATLEALVAGLRAINEGGRLGALPTLWIHGEEDQLVPIEASRAGIEAIRGDVFEQHVYAGARHEVFNETNRDEVLDDVVTFVREHLPA